MGAVCTCVVSVVQFGNEGVGIGRHGGRLHPLDGAALQSVLNIVS